MTVSADLFPAIETALVPYCARNVTGLPKFTPAALVDRINALPDAAREKALAVHYWNRLLLAVEQKNGEAIAGWLAATALAAHATGFLLPHAATGIKFTKGRKPNTGGPIRKRIEKELAKNPAMKPLQVWDKIKSKPPKGWEFFDNAAGRYIEGPKGGQGMGYPRFSEVCKEVRDKLKA